MLYYKDSSDTVYAFQSLGAVAQEKISELELTEIDTPCFNGSRLKGHPLESSVETDENGDYYDCYNDDGSVNSDDQESYESQQSAKAEYYWAKSEIETSDIQVNYCLRGNSKAVGTKFEWWAYQEACCKYASCDDDGVYSASSVNFTSEEFSFDDDPDNTYTVTADDDGRPISPSDSGVTTTAVNDE